MTAIDRWDVVAWQKTPWERRGGPIRYAGVLLVWLAVAVVNPPLAWDVFRNRRPDSPIPRLARRPGHGRRI